MKRILQAMDGVATKPVVGADSMAKFLSVIDKNDVEILNEATNPHKVTLPVQMAMQHYQQPSQIEKKKFTDTGIRKFFHDVEQEVAEEATTKQQLLRQYSQTIAERVLMREHYQTSELSHAKVLSTGPGPQDNVLDHDGRDQLGLEEAPSTMEPMKRYRMMRRISKRASIDLSDLEHATDDELHHLYQQHGLTESPTFDQPERDVHNPDVSHDKANTHPLETVINMANHDILRLADDVNGMKTMSLEGKLLVWQRMAQEFTTGGVMQTLAGRAAQIAHGIEQLKQARQTGKGIAPKRRSQISKRLE
jgi:hypothetical protein